MKLTRTFFFLSILLGLALFLRLYRLPATLTFLEDEGRDLLMVKRMLDTGRPVLLGPQTSTGNMYLGPLYYYFITPALVLGGMSPVGPAVLIGLSGVLTVYLLYRFGCYWFGESAGRLAALLYAVMPLPVYFTRNSWNPNLVPIIALLLLWYTTRLLQTKVQLRHYFYLGLLFGVMVQLHYMALVFLAALGLIILINKLKVWPELIKGLGLGILGFGLALSPFLLFELRNDFVNTQALIKFATGGEGEAIRYSLPLWLIGDKLSLVLTKLFGSLFGHAGSSSDPFAPWLALFGSGLILLGALVKNRTYRQFFLVFLISLASLLVWQENIHLHYLGFFFPLTYLLMGAITRFPKLKYFGFAFIALALIYSLPTTYNYLHSGETKQAERAADVANYIANEAGDKPYNVVSTQGFFTAPFQYYLSLEANPPTNDLADTIFVICEGQECTKEEETTVLLFLTGPSHPSLDAYLGHPQLNSFEGKRTMVSNEHVSHGLWVAKLQVEN